MKYCRKCGRAADDAHEFCSKCGARIFSESTEVASTAEPLGDAVASGADASNNERISLYQSNPNTTEQAKIFPMKWYKFLIYFSLWASAVIYIPYGLLYLTGFIYRLANDIPASAIYALLGNGLRVVDMAFGLSAIAVGVFSVITRNKLAHFSVDGPIYLYVLLAADWLIATIYDFSFYVLFPESGFTLRSTISDASVSLIVTVILTACNYRYFTRRAALFRNV